MERAGDEVGEGAEQERFFLGEIHRLESFDVENAVEMVGVENRKAHGGGGIRENGFRASLIVGERAVDCGFSGACHLAYKAGIERQALRERATACAAFRLDDEFVILMPETSMEQARQLSSKLRGWVAADPLLREKNISASFGIACYPLHGASPQELIQVADASMYLSNRRRAALRRRSRK